MWLSEPEAPSPLTPLPQGEGDACARGQRPVGRRWVLAGLAVAGCGFAPALGTGSAARGLMGQVRAADPGDALGFQFVKQIEARLGRAEAARYALTYAISTSSEGVGITGDGATTRYNLSGTVTWSLSAAGQGGSGQGGTGQGGTGQGGSGQSLAGGSVDSFASYSATGSTVAGLAAREDAERRLMVMLADQVVTAMIAALAR